MAKQDPQRQHFTSISRIETVKRRVGLGKSTIYEGMAEGTFPHCISLGKRAVGWIDEEIDAWLEERIARSRPEAKGGDVSTPKRTHEPEVSPRPVTSRASQPDSPERGIARPAIGRASRVYDRDR
jgi:prophage regulatory protein